MPRYRADLDVSGDLVLPLGSDPFVIAGDGCVATFRNAPNDSDGYAPGLMVTVVGEATSMEDAAELLRKRLARLLDLLAFATHSKFKLVQIRRLIEWEPRMKTRQFRAYQIFDRRYPPDPELDPEYARSVGIMANGGAADFVIEALRLFRAGLLDTQQQDQFQRFWLAFEVISEGRKGSALVRIPCTRCGQGLTCSACQMSPLRRPMARQAIRAMMIQLLDPAKGEKAYKKLVAVRDGLMHGRAPEAIAMDANEKFDRLVNNMATLAWHAIMSSMPDSVLDTPLSLGHRDGDFAVKQLRVGPVGSFDCDTSTDYPSEDKIPTVKIEMQTRFRPDGS